MGSLCVRCCEQRDYRLPDLSNRDQSEASKQLDASNTCELNDRDPSEASEQLDASNTCELNDRDQSEASEQLDASNTCELKDRDQSEASKQNDVHDRDSSMVSKRSDICGTKESKFIIQSGVRFVELDSLANDISETNIKPLTEKCKNGDHYSARYNVHYRRNTGTGTRETKETLCFYVIKGTSCLEIGSLDFEWETRRVFNLHPDCQGGSHYLANRTGFYIIRRKDNTYLSVTDMSEYGYDPHTANRYKLHESYTNGLHYFATDDYFLHFEEGSRNWPSLSKN